MALEYRLAFTAQEIDEKLGKINDLENNKQDKLAFDTEPIEGSENPITSGAIYTALQNVGGGAGGSVNLTAGDGIEIKDGIIRSTLGDFIGTETEETFVEFYYEDNIETEDQGDGSYICGVYGELTNPIDTNEKLAIKFELPNGIIKTFDVDIVMFEYNEEEGVTYIGGLYNLIITDDGVVKVDENLDALYFDGAMTEEAFEIACVTFEDYTGASVTISQGSVVERNVYVTLPENALQAGNLIKIENGVVSSTLGTKITSTKEAEFLNTVLPSDSWSEYDGQIQCGDECNYMPSIGDKVNVEITLENSDTPICFNDVEVKTYYDTFPCIIVNSDQTGEDLDTDGSIIKKDESLPGIFCMWMKEEGVCYYTLLSWDNIAGASVKISGVATVSEIVKLPNNALTFDEEPTEYSKNLVNSGVVYEAIQNVKDSLVYDSTPTQNSQNLMKSGDIYNAFNNFKANEMPNYINNTVHEKVKANEISVPVVDFVSTDGEPIFETTFSTNQENYTHSGYLIYDNEWYKLIYDGVEYVSKCVIEQNIRYLRFPNTPGEFYILQLASGVFNVCKSDNKEHSIILYKLSNAPILSTTFKAGVLNCPCDNNLLVPNQRYKLEYDGVVYISKCISIMGSCSLDFAEVPGGFCITQGSSGQSDMHRTGDLSERSVVLYKLEPQMTDLTDCLNNLCLRIQKLEAQLNNN